MVHEEIIAALDEAGYRATVRVLNAADYGVPQSRRRLVLLAGRGFKIPFPQPTHAKNPKDNSRQPWVKLRDVIRNMPRPVTLSHM